MDQTIEPQLSYFGLQSYWGITKHMGGLDATDRMLALSGVRAGQTVLDVGCGVGMTACYIAQRYAVRVVGVDRQPGMIAWARRRAAQARLADQVTFEVADAQTLPCAADTFDLVVSESVTAFVPDKPAALREYKRVAKPGGWVALNEGTWTQTPPPEIVAFTRQTMDGAQFKTASEWTALLEEAELADLVSEAVQISPFQEWRDEVRRVGTADLGDYLTAWGKMLALYRRSPAFRQYIGAMRGTQRTARDMFKYYGYGIYAGRKGGQRT